MTVTILSLELKVIRSAPQMIRCWWQEVLDPQFAAAAPEAAQILN